MKARDAIKRIEAGNRNHCWPSLGRIGSEGADVYTEAGRPGMCSYTVFLNRQPLATAPTFPTFRIASRPPGLWKERVNRSGRQLSSASKECGCRGMPFPNPSRISNKSKSRDKPGSGSAVAPRPAIPVQWEGSDPGANGTAGEARLASPKPTTFFIMIWRKDACARRARGFRFLKR